MKNSLKWTKAGLNRQKKELAHLKIDNGNSGIWRKKKIEGKQTTVGMIEWTVSASGSPRRRKERNGHRKCWKNNGQKPPKSDGIHGHKHPRISTSDGLHGHEHLRISTNSK